VINLQLGQIIQWVGTAELGCIDQTHEDITDSSNGRSKG